MLVGPVTVFVVMNKEPQACCTKCASYNIVSGII